MKPKHILLDWDGTIQPDYYAAPDRFTGTASSTAAKAERARYATHSVGNNELTVDPDVVTRLNSLSLLPGVTVFWLTCTGPIAPTVYAPAVGLAEFANSPLASDAAGQPGSPSTGALSQLWWKAVAVRRHLLESNADVLWIDDRLDGDLQRFMEPWRGERGNTLSWVRPDTRLGLSPDDLDIVERWADTGERVRRARWI